MNRTAGFITPMVLFFCIAAPAAALPKFASRTGAKCQSCHVNPTGGGMRTEYGRTYGRDDITLPTFKEQTDLDKFPAALAENISIGGDFRTLYFHDQASGNSSFFQMQGDLYLDIRLNNVVSAYIDKGLYNDSFEFFGLAKILPLNGYIKAGRFLPAYGTHIDDHTAFIRGGPFGNPALIALLPAGYPVGLLFGVHAEDTGIEIGCAPGSFTFSAGVFNGTPGSSQPISGTKQKAIVLRGDTRVSLGGINVNLGGSVYVVPNSRENTIYGFFGAISPWHDVTLTTEVDFVEATHPAISQSTGIMFWNELNWMVTPGIDLKVGYEFYDPDRDRHNGSVAQATIGAEFFILTGVELRPLYRIGLEDVPSGSTVDNNQLQVLLHLFF